jgi:1-acyl-sn-glycerol-3-phosphate acyltransferase
MGSHFVVANHQATLDVAVAVELSYRLGFRFATWAHPEVVQRIPALRRRDFLSAGDDAPSFRQLVARTRAVMRRAGRPTLMWIFPEGQFGHSSAEIRPRAGPLAAFRACPEAGVIAGGLDYTIFRRARPHCCVALHATGRMHSVAELRLSLEAERDTARTLSAAVLPVVMPPLGARQAHSSGSGRWFHFA